MKLNKNGWGLLEFFIFLGIFIFCLLVSAFALRKVGLLDENWNFSFYHDQKPTPQEKTDYSEVEENMISASKKYINDFYNNQLGLDTLHIKVSSLVENNYMSEITDKDGKCSGYISVYVDDNGASVYKPYLKCKSYTTSGYVERHDG